MSPATRIDPYLSGNFLVNIEGVTTSAFSEALGLDAAIDVVDYRTGDQKENSAQKLPGLNRYADVTLKRGLTQDLSLWNWINSVLPGGHHSARSERQSRVELEVDKCVAVPLDGPRAGCQLQRSGV